MSVSRRLSKIGWELTTIPKEKMSAGVFCTALAHASGLLQNIFPESRFSRPRALGGSTTASLQVRDLYISKLKGAIAVLKQVHHNVGRFNVYQVQAAVDVINWLIWSEELTVALHVLKKMGHDVDFEEQRCDILGWEVCWAVGWR